MTSHAWRLDRRTARVMASIVTGLPSLRMDCGGAPGLRCVASGRRALAKVDKAKADL